MYLLSKKEPGIIKYWAIKKRYGIDTKMSDEKSVISRQLSNDCWISFKDRNIDNYIKLFEVIRTKLNIDFESNLYFVFAEKEEENIYTDEAFESNSENTISKSEYIEEKNKILEEAERVKLLKQAEVFASKF